MLFPQEQVISDLLTDAVLPQVETRRFEGNPHLLPTSIIFYLVF